MRFTLIDMMMPVGLMLFVTVLVPPSFLFHHPLLAPVVTILIYYLALAPFVYRKFGLSPMRLPRCACCGQWGEGFHVLANWPRIRCRCFQCEGEFVVWFDGKVGRDETWETPVLILKWPYVFGPYRKVEKPKPPT